MKKNLIICIVLIISIICNITNIKTVSADTKTDKTPAELGQLYAKSACLIDADSGRILFGKNENNVLPMASTTKIMTCIVALEYSNLENIVGVSEYASSMPDVQLNMKKGEHFKLEDLLYSLMLESHNDSAVAIAEYIGASLTGKQDSVCENTKDQSKDYVHAFTELMNQKARDIGCFSTYFITPNGLDASAQVTAEDNTVTTRCHSTTAAELAKIMAYCIKRSPCNEQFLTITRTEMHSFSNIAQENSQSQSRTFSCHNHNAFLKMMDGALSGKTGFTGDAGYCYVGALSRDGKTFVVALLACGWPNNKTYKWSDTRKLMNYGLSNYNNFDISTVQVPKLNEVIVHHAKTNGFHTSIGITPEIEEMIDNSKNVLLNQKENIDVIIKMKTELDAPVESGALIGNVLYYADGYLIYSRAIKVKDFIPRANYKSFLSDVVSLWSKGVIGCLSHL